MVFHLEGGQSCPQPVFSRLCSALLLLALPLAAQEPPDSQPELLVEKVAHGFRFIKGPVWSRDGYLLFSDIPCGKIMKRSPDGDTEVYREASNGAAGNAFDAQGRLYTCETHTRRVTRTDKKGRIEVLADKWDGKRLNAPNDIVVSKSGHAYFTDPAFGNQQDTRELDFYGVFHISPKGRLSVVAKPTGRPNGIALSPSGRILYVANSDERNIRAYDVDRDGEVSNERVAVSNIAGIPLGIRTDDKGNLYVAAKGIAVYSPEGKLLSTIPVAETPSNCAFGDADMQTLYITARTSLYRVRLSLK
ncbi:MAG TPA: SMP-30/gluconolactonase/LRE family protein [Bryobacteraceae bacterium]|jgi:gluconolactonase|nr:SMP-30/gluconolactonase/LRE family protein [Bryobacteraceae bacterium]